MTSKSTPLISICSTVNKDGWMDGWLGFNSILSKQISAISCLRMFNVY